MVSVYHGAGWTIGNFQQRFFFSIEGQDQMVGRVGSLWMEEEFCILPPHFKDLKAITDEDWELIVPGYQNYPLCTSVIYHNEWIERSSSKPS